MEGEHGPRSGWYVLRDGRRHVVPYLHEFATHAKGRWLGRKVIDVLKDEFPHAADWTSAYFEDASATGRLTLNGRPATLEDSFRDGDRLIHAVQREEPSVPAAEPIRVLLCEPDLLAVNKPAGVPVHHAGRYRRNTVVEILQFERPDLNLSQNTPGDHPNVSCNGSGKQCGNGSLHVIHRLDREVSGVLLVARTPSCAAALNAAMTEGHMRKHYVARVAGLLTVGSSWAVSAPILVHSSQGKTVTSCNERGKPAHTLFWCIGRDESTKTSLLICEPITGRSHQIRLHLKNCGHPIANDPLYSLAAEHRPVWSTGPESKFTPADCASEPSQKRKRDKSHTSSGNTTTSEVHNQPYSPVEGPDEMWLHALAYGCEGGARPFNVVSATPGWAQTFGQLPCISGDALSLSEESLRTTTLDGYSSHQLLCVAPRAQSSTRSALPSHCRQTKAKRCLTSAGGGLVSCHCLRESPPPTIDCNALRCQ